MSLQRSMANLQRLNKHSNELKKATTLEDKLKKTKEDLVFECTTLVEELKSSAKVAAIAMEKVTDARTERDKVQGKLAEL